MTPTAVIATATDIYTARTVMSALKEAGWIVVRHDAIRLAQAHAQADNDDAPCKPPAPADWHGIKGDPPKRAA